MKKSLLLWTLVPSAGVIVSFVACNGQSLDLGANARGNDGGVSSTGTPGTGSSSGGGSDATSGGSDTTADDEGDDEVWSGYVENYTFPSGADALLLTLTRNADGGVTGHAVFGNEPLYPPPTDGSVGYPVADEPYGIEPMSLEGFRYPLHDGTIEQGTRFRADLIPTELYASWCALQTPHASDFLLDDGGPRTGAPFTEAPSEAHRRAVQIATWGSTAERWRRSTAPTRMSASPFAPARRLHAPRPTRRDFPLSTSSSRRRSKRQHRSCLRARVRSTSTSPAGKHPRKHHFPYLPRLHVHQEHAVGPERHGVLQHLPPRRRGLDSRRHRAGLHLGDVASPRLLHQVIGA